MCIRDRYFLLLKPLSGVLSLLRLLLLLVLLPPLPPLPLLIIRSLPLPIGVFEGDLLTTGVVFMFVSYLLSRTCVFAR